MAQRGPEAHTLSHRDPAGEYSGRTSSLQPQPDRKSVNRQESGRIEGGVEQVLPALEHRAHGVGVVLVAKAFLAKPCEDKERADDHRNNRRDPGPLASRARSGHRPEKTLAAGRQLRSEPVERPLFPLLQEAILGSRTSRAGTLMDSDALNMRPWQSGTQTRSNAATRLFHNAKEWQGFTSGQQRSRISRAWKPAGQAARFEVQQPVPLPDPAPGASHHAPGTRGGGRTRLTARQERPQLLEDLAFWLVA